MSPECRPKCFGEYGQVTLSYAMAANMRRNAGWRLLKWKNASGSMEMNLLLQTATLANIEKNAR